MQQTGIWFFDDPLKEAGPEDCKSSRTRVGMLWGLLGDAINKMDKAADRALWQW